MMKKIFLPLLILSLTGCLASNNTIPVSTYNQAPTYTPQSININDLLHKDLMYAEQQLNYRGLTPAGNGLWYSLNSQQCFQIIAAGRNVGNIIAVPVQQCANAGNYQALNQQPLQNTYPNQINPSFTNANFNINLLRNTPVDYAKQTLLANGFIAIGNGYWNNNSRQCVQLKVHKGMVRDVDNEKPKRCHQH